MVLHNFTVCKYANYVMSRGNQFEMIFKNNYLNYNIRFY